MHRVFDLFKVRLIFNDWHTDDPEYRLESPTHQALGCIYGPVQAFHEGSLQDMTAMSVNIFLHAAREHGLAYKMQDVLSWAETMQGQLGSRRVKRLNQSQMGCNCVKNIPRLPSRCGANPYY